MTLLDRSLKYLSVALLLVLAAWATVFHLSMLDEVYDNIDDGLKDHKKLLIHRAKRDSTVLSHSDFSETNYAITPIAAPQGKKPKDAYRDTVMLIPHKGKMEPVRLLTTVFEADGRWYRMELYTSTVEEDDLMEKLLESLAGLYVLLLLTIILVNKVVLGRIWRPFHAILRQLKDYRLGSGDRLEDVPTNVREFRELKAAANALVRHASDTYRNQRAFTENAAHELQTPLAIAINKLELFAEKGGMDKERMADIARAIAILERLVRLNRSLLLLARIENRQFPDTKSVSLGEVCAQLVEEFRPFAEFKGVEVSFTEKAVLERGMDPELARVLVSNLLRNAITHNVPGGGVWVEVTAEGLTILNTGAKEPLDPVRIFERFHKETTVEGGTGLGLSIAKAIADMYGFSLGYTYADGHRMALRC